MPTPLYACLGQYSTAQMVSALRNATSCNPSVLGDRSIKLQLTGKSRLIFFNYRVWSIMALLISRPIIFSFFLIFLFSGPGWNKNELIDISNYRGFSDLSLAFKQAGFANQSIDEYKLLPCSLGTFVNASSKDPKCLECPAGNFS